VTCRMNKGGAARSQTYVVKGGCDVVKVGALTIRLFYHRGSVDTTQGHAILN
jgi:hypothetical protein